MKINKLVKVGERTEEKTRVIPATYDDNGNILTEETTETYSVIVPIMKAMSVEATEEEIAEMQAQEIPQELPSAEERIEILEQAFMEFVSEVLEND